MVDSTASSPENDVAAILSNLNNIDTNGTYSSDAVGSAVLTILDGDNNPQKSNYGSNSFQVTNTGDKQIAAIAIDFRDAVFGDSVVDPDGKGGDNAAKVLSINSGGNTGAFVNQDRAYILEGSDPLANTTGTGIASNGGYRGLLIEFSGGSGGFSNGETVGFSGDMDPNSIAGLDKSGSNGVDTGAISGWDVGGISGSELIGSKFTIIFDDGTTATGYLYSDKSQSGSIGEAIEGAPEKTATLSVITDGALLDAGGVGTYGGAAPDITVTGTPGDTVRVVLQKGFNPVTNSNNGIDDLVEARLEAYNPDFAVSNSFDLQTYDVVIPASGSVTLPADAFDYNSTDSGVSFDDDNKQPIALTAAVIVPASDNTPDVLNGDENVAAGPVSAPIYLTNNGYAVGENMPVVTPPVETPETPEPVETPETPEPVLSDQFTIELFDASTDQVISDIWEGAEISHNVSIDQLTFKADFIGDGDADQEDGSIRFTLRDADGDVLASRVESYMPYALFGDSNGGQDLKAGNIDLDYGDYTLTLIAYDQNRGKGNKLAEETFEFTLVDPDTFVTPVEPVEPPVETPVLSDLFDIELFNAASDTVISDIYDGATIAHTADLDQLTIKADYIGDGDAGQDDGSLVFQFYDGQGDLIIKKTESYMPYALFGDRNSGKDLKSGGIDFEDGDYTLKLSAYSSNGGKGTLLAQETIEFTLSSDLFDLG